MKQKLYEFIWRYFAGCREVAELASAELDGAALPWRKRISMRLHVWSCAGCRNYLEHLRFMREVFRRSKAAEVSSESLSGDARERLKNAVRAANSENP